MSANATPSTSAAGLMDLLLRSGEALRNWRALTTLMGTGVATIVIFLALASSGNGFLIFLGVVLAYLIASVGLSATGILLMDQALCVPPRSIGAALFDGIFAAMRLFVIVLIGLAIALLAILAVAILLVICKVPGLGGFLYAVVLPTCALALAFINFLNEPENGAQLAGYIFQATPNLAAKKLLPPEHLHNTIIWPDEKTMARSEPYAPLPPRAGG